VREVQNRQTFPRTRQVQVKVAGQHCTFPLACNCCDCRIGGSIQQVARPAVAWDGEKAPALKFGQPRRMALFSALTLFQHLIDGFHNRDLRQPGAGLLGGAVSEYTGSQMTCDLRRLRRKGLISYGPPTLQYLHGPHRDDPEADPG